MIKIFQKYSLYWITRLLITCAGCAGAGLAMAAASDADPAASLRAKYAELGDQLSNNQFKRPLYLDSAESSSHLKGDIYAVVDHPFATVNTALNGPAHWCDVLILHLNTKYCRASTNGAGSLLKVSIGKKHDQPLEDAYPVEFAYAVTATTPKYFEVQLRAGTGPLGTSDYRIMLEAVSLPDNRTFLHLTYSYAYNFAGGVAMKGYLATVGSGKIGFTNTGKQPNGQPKYIGGVRGVVERNTMRYYLAIDAYLSAMAAPGSEQLEKRLQNWFESTERYTRQLHEVDRASYLSMKRIEYRRQQTVVQ
ncbi:MAG: hypothetical protein A3J24_12795 [Deltaproteobacteria bacterium RIFCSPLOWO2_02_FULL_53_8]|nr:MAG: hypothetical protein A3J24_12795 [Deltaproteobacteria bacterium RIFCSPLOWO2_02_FULL_53_8]